MPRKAPEPETEEAKRIREDTEAVADIMSNALAWRSEARMLTEELVRARDRIARLEDMVREYEVQIAVAQRAMTIKIDPSWVLWLDRLRADGLTDSQIGHALRVLIELRGE